MNIIVKKMLDGTYNVGVKYEKVQFIRERKLLSVARQRKGYTAIKRGIAQLLTSEGSSFDEVRKTILEQKGKLSIGVCEDWARGLGWETLGFKQSLPFATEEIFDFLVKTLVGKTDEVNEDRIYVYGKATYSYDLNQVDKYYWRCVGMILWSAR